MSCDPVESRFHTQIGTAASIEEGILLDNGLVGRRINIDYDPTWLDRPFCDVEITAAIDIPFVVGAPVTLLPVPGLA